MKKGQTKEWFGAALASHLPRKSTKSHSPKCDTFIEDDQELHRLDPFLSVIDPKLSDGARRITLARYCGLEHTILWIHIAHLSCQKYKIKQMYLNGAYFMLDNETLHNDTSVLYGKVQGPLLAQRLKGCRALDRRPGSLGPHSADSSEESSCSSWWLVLSLSQLCVLE